MVEKLPNCSGKFGKSYVKNYYQKLGVRKDSFAFSLVSEEKVLKYLLKISANKATGLDGIPARFIKDSASIAVIFLPMKLTPVTGIVPKAKKYLFFPIGARKIPKMSDNFPIKTKPILTSCRSHQFVIQSIFYSIFFNQETRNCEEIRLLAPVTLFCLRSIHVLGSLIFNLTAFPAAVNQVTKMIFERKNI